MHLTRAELSSKMPLPRKGTKYIARAKGHMKNSVPVVVALRDVIKLCKTAREVKHLVHKNLIKVNGKIVKDIRYPIKILEILECGDMYILTINNHGKYLFEPIKEKSRICKVISKKVNRNGIVQLNLHDGTNIVSKEDISVNDSLELDFSNKVKKVIKMKKGAEVIVVSGKSNGLKGKIENIEGKKASLKLQQGKEVVLETKHIIAI